MVENMVQNNEAPVTEQVPVTITEGVAKQDTPVQQLFRLTPREDERLDNMVELAYLAGLINEPSKQAYIIFCLNIGGQEVFAKLRKMGVS